MTENTLLPTFTENDVVFTEVTKLFNGFFQMNGYGFRHRLFSGEWSDVVHREIFERGHAAAILLYDAKKDTVVLVEQFRMGALLADCAPWQLEIVAGMIETDEQAESVAVRETEEEAGLSVLQLRPMLNYLASPGGTSERLFLFIGEVDSTQAMGIHGLSEEGEDIRVQVVGRQQAYEWVELGKIENAATVIALQWLQLHLNEIQTEWSLT